MGNVGYKKVSQQLNAIKELCIKFETKDLYYYKTLQDIHNYQKFLKNQLEFADKEVIEIRKMFLLGKNIESLNVKEDTLLLLGNDEFNAKDLVLKTRIIIHTLDINSNKETIFEAEIVNFGRIDKNETKSYEITFSERFIALRSDKMIPFVFSNHSQVIGEKQLKKCKYFINLKIYNRKDLLNSINNITDKDIWETSSLNNKIENEYCDEILKSKQSEDLIKAIKNSNLNEILENKLAEKIKNTINNDLGLFKIEPIIPFENYKTGLIKVEAYLKYKFHIGQEDSLPYDKIVNEILKSKFNNDKQLRLEDIAELDNFTKGVFEQKELTKLSIAVYEKL